MHCSVSFRGLCFSDHHLQEFEPDVELAILDTDLGISVELTCSAPAFYPTPLVCCFVLAYYTGERITRLGRGTKLAEV